MASPASGSILTTSAPWSASTMVASGPDMLELRSTTVIPASGRVGSLTSPTSLPSLTAVSRARMCRTCQILYDPHMPIDQDVADELVGIIREWVRKEVIPNASAFEHADEFPADFVAQMRDFGLFGARIPEE